MRTKPGVSLLTAALLAGVLLGPPPAIARDLVKETARVAMADEEEPPKSRSELLGQQEQEQQRQAAAEAELARKQQEADTPYYRKWWFWALSAAVVGGTVALGVWAVDPGTKPANACPAGVLVCFGDGRMEIR